MIYDLRPLGVPAALIFRVQGLLGTPTPKWSTVDFAAGGGGGLRGGGELGGGGLGGGGLGGGGLGWGGW